ncbi:aromatic-ring-hydroxylating dioxygenase subunit beta [Pigmentiphaga soli]|uniref:Aromatic-ring-hydroxylating dioxygenase subunit beta n=1 Tax=Pigmentiphaga soli TaxID=1007095 RepID=A0ABP8HTP3_9BURK
MTERGGPAPDLAEIQRFVYREARLLDERRFAEWRELFAEDGAYWVPTRHDQASPDEAVSIFYDTRKTMQARIDRLAHPDAHVQAPPSHTTHLVSNIELEPEPAPGGAWIAHAAFVMAEYRHTEPRWYAGRYQYRLLRDGAALKIALKKVVLVDCIRSFTAMAVYL